MLQNSTSTLAEQAIAVPSFPPAERTGAARVARAVEVALLLIAAAFFALHFVHLRADFPNHSPWMDWAKYTDEGWYGDAAIRHYQLGHWYVPGDFNPAAALPVWPLLELALFRATGVSAAAARALTVVVFGLTLVCVYLLMRRLPGMWRARGVQPENAGAGTTLAPAIAVLLLAVSPFCYAFTRLAILEPLLILAALAALLAASAAGAAQANSEARGDGARKRAKRPAQRHRPRLRSRRRPPVPPHRHRSRPTPHPARHPSHGRKNMKRCPSSMHRSPARSSRSACK